MGKKQDLWLGLTDPLFEAESMVSFLKEVCCVSSSEIQKLEGLSVILQEINDRIHSAIEMFERMNKK